jgi:hypothetical protein
MVSSAGTGALNNFGTIEKSTTGTWTMGGGVPFRSEGLARLAEGELVLSGGGTLGGTFVVDSGASLRTSTGSVTLANGVDFIGQGTVRFNGATVLGGSISFGTLLVVFETSASLSGAGDLANADGGQLMFLRSLTVPGSLSLGGSLELGAGLVVTISGTLTLESTGTIDNSGTLNVGAFVDNGGAIIGNPPVELGLPVPGATELMIQSIGLDDVDHGLAPASAIGRGLIRESVTLHWRGSRSGGYVVEGSDDLVRWQVVEAAIASDGDGHYVGTVSAELRPTRFYRVRQISPSDQPAAAPSPTRNPDWPQPYRPR